MKKIVRLTESDLIKLVKRVIHEQAQPDKKITDAISKCGVEGGIGLIMKFPKCFGLAKDFIDGKVGVFDGATRMMECTKELTGANQEDVKNVMKILQCVGGSMSSPVMY